MPDNNTNRKKSRKFPVFWSLFLGSIAVFALLLLFQPERDAIDHKHLPWNAHIDEAGKLHALGLTLQQSTLKQAMSLYGKDVEVKIFSEKDESNKSLEAYFPVIYIGSIKAALALRIEASEAEIDSAYSNGKKTTVTTSGGREVELYSSDVARFFDSPISSLTLIPRKNLTERAIDKRFGTPDKTEIQSDGLAHWFFYDLGLELIIDKEGPEALQYAMPIAK